MPPQRAFDPIQRRAPPRLYTPFAPPLQPIRDAARTGLF